MTATAENVPRQIQADAAFVSPERGRIAQLSPEMWLIDHTFISEEFVEEIRRQCFEAGSIPLIDHHPKYGWVFHTLIRHGAIHEKNIAHEFRTPVPRRASEKDMEDQVCLHLEARQIPHDRQVACDAGIADVVTETTVYELKQSTSGHHVFLAIGQALAYRVALQRSHAVILTQDPDEHALHIGDLLDVPILDHRDAIKKGLIS